MKSSSMEHLHERTISDYLAVLRRRKWIVLVAVVLAPAVAVVLSSSKPNLYAASADVLLTSTATGVQSALDGDPTSVIQTQGEIAASPVVAERVLRAAHVTNRTAGELLSEASFGSASGADVMRITITDRDPALASRLADAYARQYTQYRRELDVSFVTQARKQIEARIAALRHAGGQGSAVYATLVQKQQDLLEIEALQTASALVLRPAGGAAHVQPKPTRDGILGFGIGLVLGIGLALLWDVLDTRVRAASDIAKLLGQPLLGRLAAPPRRLRSERRLVMLEDVGGPEAEAFRVLRTNLDFVNVDGRTKLIMVTSAAPGEGKSTTVANLGVALARAGRRVVVVDLDLRRPIIDTLFGLPSASGGLTSVALARLDLSRAVTDVLIPVPDRGARIAANGSNGRNGTMRILKVLTAGPLPPDPGEFVSTAAVRSILNALCEQADIVLIDAPPLLGLGDAVALTAAVDGVILVTRVGTARRPLLRETRRILDSTPVAKLGFVITGAEREEGYGYAQQAYYDTAANATGNGSSGRNSVTEATSPSLAGPE